MKLFSLLFLILIGYSAAAQNTPSQDDMYYWKVLSKVKFKSNFDRESGELIYQPVFGKHIQELDGKKIHVKGYMIPADMTGGQLTLSAYPFSSCYFCGGAGPETVIEIYAKTPIIYRMDKPITIQGTLELNYDDPFRLLYILKDAEYYEGD